LPGRKGQDAREVIVVPGHLFLAEEANDLLLAGGGGGVYEEIV
jgi:hypothetical protein